MRKVLVAIALLTALVSASEVEIGTVGATSKGFPFGC